MFSCSCSLQKKLNYSSDFIVPDHNFNEIDTISELDYSNEKNWAFRYDLNDYKKIIPKNINPNYYLPFNIPGVEILISVIFITIVGGISLSFFGRRILKLIDDLFKRIPFLRTVYSAIVQMTETFSKKNDNKRSVVLIEYPRKGVWAVGFATKENTGEMAEKTNKKLINVFVPTTPNPTSGFLLMFPLEDVIYLNMSFEEASKFIVSAGTSTKKS